MLRSEASVQYRYYRMRQMLKVQCDNNCLPYRQVTCELAITQKILSYLDKHGSPITANNTKEPRFEAVQQTAVFDAFIIQREFDLGAK